MTNLKFLLLITLILLLSTLSACGESSNPLTGEISVGDPINGVSIGNTGDLTFDGTTYGGIENPEVAPGSSHFVTPNSPDASGPRVWNLSCSEGTWYSHGVNMGKDWVAEGSAFEWRAPSRPCRDQLILQPADSSGNSMRGVVIDVKENPFLVPVNPENIDRELAIVSPVSGKTVVAAAGEFLVKLSDAVPITEVLELRSAQDYQVLERISAREPVFRIKLDPGVDMLQAWNELRADPRIEFVEPNYIAYPAMVPDDPEYSQKFEFPKISAEQAWDLETGSADVWVAVVDTGVDRNHPDLANNVVPGVDFITGGDGLGGETPGDGIDNNQDGVVDGNVGHGSHVSGIIAAEAFNGEGACGVAPNVTILPLRIFPTNGDTGATFSSIIEAVGYATEQPNVRVISMSIGTTYESPLLQEAVNNAWDAGKVLVAAAANSNTDVPYYPGAHEHVVAVAALNKQGQKASFSNYGPWVDISAYGTGIYSTYFDDGYALMSGTSMACPLVSGCMALLFSFDPDLTNEQAVSALLGSTDDVDTANPDWVGMLGSGTVNPFKALQLVENSQPGEVDDGASDGSVSDTVLELGPHGQG
jgi:subtilisin family serine protease